ncbi:MAG: serine/threonine protein kinase [Sphingomonadales bacterium]|nr:MAG: serine/threonine protein kinase [Sphingomonadales bacterium]
MSAAFLPGQTLIDRYQLIDFHGAGGMQQVYLCRDLALDRTVVLKTPKAGIEDRRFRRGAEMGARVHHQNAAATYDYYEDELLTFMIEEFVQGRDLGKRFSDDFHFMDPALTAHVLHHLARALHEAHSVGICHRDIKPSNIIVSDDPGLRVIKLTDFGIAKMAESEIGAEIGRFGNDNSTLTASASSTLLGAVPYMAPECWEDWRLAGKPMDIWAVGCIGYQLLSGNLPFGSGAAAIGHVIRAGQTGNVTLTKPAWFGYHAATRPLEDDLWSFITACIQPNQNLRPTAAQLRDMTDAFCYPAAIRKEGTISSFGIRYPSGGFSRSGSIRDSETNGECFFHGDDFYGTVRPTPGQRVSYSIYAGNPRSRASPVLQLKTP